MKALSLLLSGHPKKNLRTLRAHKKEKQKSEWVLFLLLSRGQVEYEVAFIPSERAARL